VNQYAPDPSKKSFLFTLKNPHGIAPRTFSLSNSVEAIAGPSFYGPWFGRHDIRIHTACDANTDSDTQLGNSYVNDTGIDGQRVLAGEAKFMVKEIEVFAAVF
jgi:hypothetical protein